MIAGLLREEKASSVAEMAILVSVYVAIITAAVLLGGIALLKMRAQTVVGDLAMEPEEQGMADAAEQIPHSPSTSITAFSDKIDENEMWDAGDIGQTLEDLARAPVGYYEYRDGEIIYVLDEDRLSAFGQYVFDHNLEAESGNIADILAGWMYRSKATMSCRFKPVFGDWDPADINDLSSSSHVLGDKERGKHPENEPDFNRDILELLDGSSELPPALPAETALWLPTDK
jgi:hypothetical protein